MLIETTLDKSVLTQLNAIPLAEVRRPTMPVKLYLQEAEDLYSWATFDKDALLGAGMDWAIVEEISLRSAILRDAQTDWDESRFTKEEVEKNWRTAQEDGYELRDHLLHYSRFAYRDHSDLLRRVAEIAEGNSHADMIQDLHDLGSLGQSNIELLEAINLDLGLLDKAEKLSDQLARFYGDANAARANDNEYRLLRDRAFTYLKFVVDEIRDYGQFVFWKKAERLKGYRSDYLNRISRRKNSQGEPPPLEPNLETQSETETITDS